MTNKIIILSCIMTYIKTLQFLGDEKLSVFMRTASDVRHVLFSSAAIIQSKELNAIQYPAYLYQHLRCLS